jgi:hypothetical protein
MKYFMAIIVMFAGLSLHGGTKFEQAVARVSAQAPATRAPLLTVASPTDWYTVINRAAFVTALARIYFAYKVTYQLHLPEATPLTWYMKYWVAILPQWLQTVMATSSFAMQTTYIITQTMMLRLCMHGLIWCSGVSA